MDRHFVDANEFMERFMTFDPNSPDLPQYTDNALSKSRGALTHKISHQASTAKNTHGDVPSYLLPFPPRRRADDLITSYGDNVSLPDTELEAAPQTKCKALGQQSTKNRPARQLPALKIAPPPTLRPLDCSYLDLPSLDSVATCVPRIFTVTAATACLAPVGAGIEPSTGTPGRGESRAGKLKSSYDPSPRRSRPGSVKSTSTAVPLRTIVSAETFKEASRIVDAAVNMAAQRNSTKDDSAGFPRYVCNQILLSHNSLLNTARWSALMSPLANLRKLVYLDLSHNHLREVPREVADCGAPLHTLLLHSNNIAELHGIIYLAPLAGSLITLTLQGNPCERVGQCRGGLLPHKAVAIATLPYLKRLDGGTVLDSDRNVAFSAHKETLLAAACRR